MEPPTSRIGQEHNITTFSIEAFLVLDKEERQCTLDEVKKTLFVNDSAHMLSKTIQGSCSSEGGGFDYDQSWICALSNLPSLQKRHVAIARLKHPANMGRTCHEIKFLILVLTPNKEKGTKNALETGRTFATIFADMEFRQRLLEVHNEDDFKTILLKHAQDLAEEQSNPDKRLMENNVEVEYNQYENKMCRFGYGIKEDLKRRLPHYLSDYTDGEQKEKDEREKGSYCDGSGLFGHKTIHKVVSTTFFLYFACILPAIAFAVLNDNNTNGKIDMYRMIIGQTIGGLFYGVFGGQPLVVIMTTAPLSLYIKNFQRYYFNPKCTQTLANNITRNMTNLTDTIGGIADDPGGGKIDPVHICARDSSILFLLLMFGTLWLGVSLYNFNKTPYLQASKRECLADYSLPVAVLSLSFVGSFVFKEVKTDHFNYNDQNSLTFAPLYKMSFAAIMATMGLGFSLSLLFFMDQNITSAMVCNPSNKLKKGTAYHFDLLVVAILNGFLSIFGLPWMHATLPHSPLHVRCLADVEERVDQGHVYEM
ncbi:Sodium bicarbonate transporter-like protein 11 [Nymphon striatum]|nr:Sodium bicarbonate transporter-like protein 11 [Nymphon striatum]